MGFLLRAAAVFFAASGAAVLVHAFLRLLSGEPQESAMRFVARVTAALILVAGAPSLWRLPAKLPARRRRRLYELTQVLADRQLLREFQESSPSAKVLDAVTSDWLHALATARRDDTWPLFSDDEKRELAGLEAEFADRLPHLPLTTDRLADFEDIPAWAALRERARLLLEKLLDAKHGEPRSAGGADARRTRESD